jgi:acetyl esterase/lipase
MAEQEPATGGSVDTSAEIERTAEATTPASAPPPSAPVERAGTTSQPARRRRRGMWAARMILALVFLLGLFFSIVPVGRSSLQATVLLPAFLSASEPPPLQVVGEPIRHTSQTISSSNGPVYIDIYTPVSAPPAIPGKREAVVDIPGIGDNRTDPQLMNFSESMARAGLVVVNMTTPKLIALDLSPDDTDAVVQAFHLAQRQPGVDPHRVGFIGFSGGTVLACLASADARIRPQVAFMALFGSPFNIADVLRDAGRGYVIDNGQKITYHPYIFALQVLSTVMADALPYEDGQTLMDAFLPSFTPLSDPDTAFTTPGGAAAYHLLAGDDPAHVEQHLAALPPTMQTLLKQLSPSEYLSQIVAPIYLLTDHNDPSIPFTESRDFDAALTRLHHPHDFAEFGIFKHTEITSGFGLGPALSDGSKLARLLIEILQAQS